MTIENALVTCSCCDFEEDGPEADIHAVQHNESTGHRVQMNILAHVGA